MLVTTPRLSPARSFAGLLARFLARFVTSAGFLLFALSTVAQQPYYPPGIELPAGTGRELVLQACTRCHDLKGVPAFKGYWTRQQWLAMIETMVKHGAPLNAGQAGEVADYLSQHYGRAGAPALRAGSAP